MKMMKTGKKKKKTRQIGSMVSIRLWKIECAVGCFLSVTRYMPTRNHSLFKGVEV